VKTLHSQTQCVATRRQALVGAASIAITTATGHQATAFIVPWAVRVGAGVASGWMVEALKNWGLVPGAKRDTAAAVQNDHLQKSADLQRQGYTVQALYAGDSAAGDFALSEARSGEDFLALGTTTHATTCTVKLDKADLASLAFTASALRQKGFEPRAIEAAGHPIHPAADNRLVGSTRYSPNYLTPSGTIAWKTNVGNPRPNLVTAVRSGLINANLHFARLDSGKWVFDLRAAVPI
jgi:hypothetical protein